VHSDRGVKSPGCQQRRGASDLARARQKHQHVAGLRLQRVVHRSGRCDVDRSIRTSPHIAGFDRVLASFGRHDRRPVEQSRYPLAVERRRHDQYPKVLAHQPAAMQREGQADIAVKAPLVELVEDDESDALEARIRREQSGQDALRDDLDPGGRPYPGIAANPVAHGGSDRLLEQASHPTRRGPSCQPARLQHHDTVPAQPRLLQQRERHPGGLTRAGRRLQHRCPPLAKCAAQRGQRAVDRKRGRRHRPKLTAPLYRLRVRRDSL
jgi:hypothetical protein